MKRWFMLVGLMSLLLLPIVAQASPSVVSDPYTVGMVQPTKFEVQDQTGVDGSGNPIWGSTINSTPEDLGGATCRVKYDIGAYSVGPHTIRVRAVGILGDVSAWAIPPFTFTHPTAPILPSGFALLLVGSDLYVISASYPAAAQVDLFTVTMDGGAAVDSPAQVQSDTTTRLYYKITGISVGNHNMTIVAKQNVWSQQSNAAAYAFTNPGAPTTPTNLKIVK